MTPENKASAARPPQQIYERYVRERRGCEFDGYRREEWPWLVRYTALPPGAEGLVIYANLPAGREREIIAGQIAYFKGIGQRFEWKVYEGDRPENLARLLQAEGFQEEAPEEFMVLDLKTAPASALPADPAVRVNKIGTGEIGDVIAVQREVYGTDTYWRAEHLTNALTKQPEKITVYCAYMEDRPIGTGWIEYPAGNVFADLFGGAVIPPERGKGVYTQLLLARIREAQARGMQFLAVDAAPMSRPILARKGFAMVGRTYPMRLAK